MKKLRWRASAVVFTVVGAVFAADCPARWGFEPQDGAQIAREATEGSGSDLRPQHRRSRPRRRGPRERRDRQRSARWHWRGIGAMAGGMVLAGAWALDVGPAVLVILGAGTVMARQHVLAVRRVPPRLAAWAVHAPRGPCPPAAPEHAIAADLAALSSGHIDCLDRAQLAVEEHMEDPWRRALAAERLGTAQELLAGGCLAGVAARRETPAGRLRHAAAAISMIVVISLGSSAQSRWWLLALGAATVLLTLEFAELYERRRALPGLLASRSLEDPARRPFVMPEHHVACSIAVLAGTDGSIIRRALRLLEEADVVPPDYARRRLLHAGRLVAELGGRRSTRGLAAWLLTGAVLVGVASVPYGLE